MKALALFIFILLCGSLSFAQKPAKTKNGLPKSGVKTSAKVVPSTYMLVPGPPKTIIINADNEENLLSATVHLKFILAGDVPKNDLSLNLSIYCNSASINPQFSTGNPIVTAYKLKITIPRKAYIAPSNLYIADVDVKYHTIKDTLTQAITAFINIDGINDPNQVYPIKFINKATKIAGGSASSVKSSAKPDTAKTDGKSADPKGQTKTSKANTLVKHKRTITVSPASDGEKLITDTAKLTFQLSSPLGKNDSLVIKKKLRLVSFNNTLITPLFYKNPGSLSDTITVSTTIKFDNVTKDNTYGFSVVFGYHNPGEILTVPVNSNIVEISDDDQANHSYSLNFINKSDVNETASFWIEAGANFDLIKGGSPNNFYTGVFSFEKDVTSFPTPKWLKYLGHGDDLKISLTGGAYESQSSSTSFSSDSGFVYRDGSSYDFNKAKSGYPFFRDVGGTTTTSNIQSIGVFFSPHLLLNNIPTVNNGWHIYLSGYAEILWQQVKTTFDYSKSTRDTLATKYEPTLDALSKHIFRESSINLDYRSHYFGLGLPIYIKENSYTFYLNSVFGLTNQRFVLVQDHLSPGTYAKDYRDYKQGPIPNTDPNPLVYGFLVPYNAWNNFYVEQFRLTSEEFGITFTGEVRGLLLHNSKPIITLSLSKKLDPGKFFSSILGKNSTSK